MKRTEEQAYAGDVLLLLGALATFGPWGAAAAIAASLIRHSPTIIGGVLSMAELAAGSPLALPASPRVAALLPGAAGLAPRPTRQGRGRTQGAAVALTDIADLDNLWIVGPKGSGKTTVLRTLLRVRHGGHVALDPHNTPDKWPCRVVGGGRRYGQIEGAIDAQVAEMSRRYSEMDAGRITEAWCAANRRTLVGDEWLSITKNLPARGAVKERGEIVEDAYPGAAQRLLTVLTEGRKAGVAILTASHADTATGMGLLGERDILDCFDRVIYLGAMAVKRHPAAASMTRPAVVYDPERNLYAPLIVESPAAQPLRRAAIAPVETDMLLRNLLENFSDGAKTISASGRDETVFRVSPDARETAKIAAKIARGETKTTIVKAMVGYRADRHADFVAVYETIKAAVEA